MCEIYTDASRDDNVIGIAFTGDEERRQYFIGEYTSMEAEMMAINDALRYCSERQEITIHTDCKPLVEKLDRRDDSSWNGYFETFDWLQGKYDDVTLVYVPRSENTDANRLAREVFWEGKNFYRSE